MLFQSIVGPMIPDFFNHQPVRLAGGWWLVLVFF
jgi:hypothetical protein